MQNMKQVSVKKLIEDFNFKSFGSNNEIVIRDALENDLEELNEVVKDGNKVLAEAIVENAISRSNDTADRNKLIRGLYSTFSVGQTEQTKSELREYINDYVKQKSK